MREIKFRAWDGEKMVTVNDIVLSGEKPKVYWKENSVIESSEIIMQYTGLKDKNGKEIYEGDIAVFDLSEKYKGEPVEIKWNIGGFKYAIMFECGHTCEVIGNIYENPELIKH